MAITVNKSGSTTDVVYDLLSETGAKREYINKSAGLLEAEKLMISHNMRPAGAKGSDIHVIEFSKQDVDDTTGAFTVGSARLTLTIPRATGFSTTVIRDLTKQLQCLLANAVIDALVVGVTTDGDASQAGSFVPN